MQATTCELSIIVINWNTRELLADCLASVYANLGDLSSEVIVLDNASMDDSTAMVRERYFQARLIESRENLGFARGNNLALTQAGGAYLLLLNPDTIVEEGALTRLVEIMQACPRLGALSPQLLNTDRTQQSSWGCFPSLWSELPTMRRRAERRAVADRSTIDCPCEEPLLPVDWAKGACLMIRRTALKQVGPLDEDYWLYTEEADWCYRARQLGWEIAVAPQVTIVHVEQAASRQRLAHSLIQYSRSRALFLRKHSSQYAARALWAIYAAKSSFWVLWPDRSPLGRSRNRLDATDVRNAYVALLKESLKQCTSIP